jgi:hypothetical protein
MNAIHENQATVAGTNIGLERKKSLEKLHADNATFVQTFG